MSLRSLQIWIFWYEFGVSLSGLDIKFHHKLITNLGGILVWMWRDIFMSLRSLQFWIFWYEFKVSLSGLDIKFHHRLITTLERGSLSPRIYWKSSLQIWYNTVISLKWGWSLTKIIFIGYFKICYCYSLFHNLTTALVNLLTFVEKEGIDV
jgi:hypothetical protein